MHNDLWVAYEFAASMAPWLAWLAFQRRRNLPITNPTYYLLVTFAVYVIAVFHFTQAGTLYDLLNPAFVWETNSINWHPFSTGISAVGYLLNVALFVPFGFLVPWLWRKMDRWIHVVPAGTLFSLFIELSQLFNDRITDVDDLIMNTLGVAIGYALFCGWRALRGRLGKPLPVFTLPTRTLVSSILILYFGRFLFFDETFIS